MSQPSPLRRPSSATQTDAASHQAGAGHPAITIDSRQLLPAGQSTVNIEHAGQRYTLRVTRENKLILTK